MSKDNNSEMVREKVKEDLTSYISKEFAKEEKMDIQPDTPLLEKGVIDSLSIMTLIVYIEKQYNLDFYKIDITRDSFVNINSISQIITENMNSAINAA
ncbi:MAG: hypothetical protein GWN00_19220 [Aliifodinibius sp.]|nr:acyl carrier protein [Fodinibius sp.]NIV16058.1 hypothetical protein [Fodinibius sp.]NIY26858.1 hypothetical protein [Fodinibius sp.]